MKRFSYRLLFVALVFAAGIFYGIDVVSTDHEPAGAARLLEPDRPPGGSATSPSDAAAASSVRPEGTNSSSSPSGVRTSDTGRQPQDGSASSSAAKNEFGREGASPAGPFRPEPELKISESFLNKLLNKIGEAVRWLSELGMRAVIGLVDWIFG